MDEKRLKEVIGKIQMKQEMEEEIMKNIRKAESKKVQAEKYGNKEKRIQGWEGKAVAAALVVVTVGTCGFTAHAVVNSLVKERMEAMSGEEVETIVEQTDSRQAEADTLSRELTKKEEERKRELTIAYQKGQFPQEELKQVENESQIDKEVLCYVTTTGYMYLPERELTDEEILQMVDYYEKVAYSLEERYQTEYADAAEKEKVKAQKMKQKVEVQGGISERESVAKAQEWLYKLFGETGDGMEVTHYIASEDFPVEGLDGKPFYVINYCIQGMENYYFYISSQDGTLFNMEYYNSILETEEMSLAEVENNIQTLYEAAEDYLKNSLGISEEYAEVYCSYREDNTKDTVELNRINFWFVKEDRTAYHLVLHCKDMVCVSYKITNYEEALQAEEESEADDNMNESVQIKLK